ncbi:MAG: DUF2510 domain-containing protein [Actinomycetia bacterium]|nr:DUF2510 domain-containing protein [Actinomycetes bacterium]
MSEVPAGWYPDPKRGSDKIRFWDGEKWTDRLMDNPGCVVSAAGSGEAGQSEQTQERPAAGFGQSVFPFSNRSTPGSPNRPVTSDEAAKQRRLQGCAVAGFALGSMALLLSWLGGIAFLPAVSGVVLSALGLYGPRRELAQIGLIVSLLSVVIAAAVLIITLIIIAKNPAILGNT